MNFFAGTLRDAPAILFENRSIHGVEQGFSPAIEAL
jgi:hypothetical protein